MKKGRVKFAVAAVAVLIASIVTAGVLVRHHSGGNNVKALMPDSAYQAPIYNKVVLAQFQSICHKYDSLGQRYTIAGSISVKDQADTSGTLKDLPFLCCKNGEAFYYKLGKTETINGEGFYIFIDHQAKTILLSKQKEVITDAVPKIIPDFGKQLASEDYQLSRKVDGSRETFSLINEHHISCKEYSITVDSTSDRITRMRTRLSNAQEPLRKDNEKVIDVAISRWDRTAELKSYTDAADIVHRSGNDVLPNKDYVNYQLIKM